MAVVSTITLPDETIFIIRDPNAMSKNGGTFSGRVYALTPVSDNEIATKGYVDAIVATIEGGGSSLIFTQEEKTKLAGIAAGA